LKARASLLGAAILFATVSIVSADEAYQYGPTEHDLVVSTPEEALAALDVARTLNAKNSRTGADTMALYHAEEKIGAYAYRRSEWDDEPDRDPIHVDCESYVKDNQARFRAVFDGWKGESNYFEPDSFWADALRKLSPNAKEIREIEFDLKFKDLQRAFRHDPRARGVDCATFYKDGIPADERGYAADEIESLAASCELQRKEYIRRRNTLLEEFADRPAVRKLKDVDPMEIVSEQ
jgi:hypothetical protein